MAVSASVSVCCDFYHVCISAWERFEAASTEQRNISPDAFVACCHGWNVNPFGEKTVIVDGERHHDAGRHGTQFQEMWATLASLGADVSIRAVCQSVLSNFLVRLHWAQGFWSVHKTKKLLLLRRGYFMIADSSLISANYQWIRCNFGVLPKLNIYICFLI